MQQAAALAPGAVSESLGFRTEEDLIPAGRRPAVFFEEARAIREPVIPWEGQPRYAFLGLAPAL